MSSLEAGAQGVAIHQGAPVERCCQPLQCQGLLLDCGQLSLQVQRISARPLGC